MSVLELEEILVDALHTYADHDDCDPYVRHAEEYLVSTFADCEVPKAAGVVVTIDGEEFHVSITRSK